MDILDSLAGKFITHIRSDQSEKIIVQINKDKFVVGEDLWLKAWVVNNLSNKYYKHSPTLYVDIVNEQDSAFQQIMLHIPSEKTEAKIKMEKFWPEGSYWIRLYTTSMLHADTNAMLVIPIYVYNPHKSSTTKIQARYSETLGKVAALSNSAVPSIALFPEGNNMIAGTNTLVGISIKNALGQPIMAEGYIMDENDNTLAARFTTEAKYGLASCQFFINKSHKYKAYLKWEGQLIIKELPLVNHLESQISIKEELSNYFKIVIAQGDSIYKKGAHSYLLGVHKDSLCFASDGTDMYELLIPKSHFPDGISTLLLFDANHKIVSERNIYVAKKNPNFSIQINKPQFSNRDLVDVSFATTDSLHPPLNSLSVTVTNDDLLRQNQNYYTNVVSTNLDSNIGNRNMQLLTMPASYVGLQMNQVKLDTLSGSLKMMIDTTVSDISGKIVNRKQLPMANRVVTIYTKSGLDYFDTDTTNRDGQFSFRLPIVADSTPFILQVANLKGDKLDEKIIIETVARFPKPLTPMGVKHYIDTTIIADFVKHAVVDEVFIGTGKEWLATVTVRANKKKNNYNVSKRVSTFSQVITGESLQKIGNTDASAAMLTIPGLHLRSGFVSLGGVTGFTVSEKDEPLLIIDGVMVAGGAGPQVDDGATADSGPVFNSSPVMAEISRITTDMIDFIEVLRGPEAAYYGTRSSNGVIIINTHRVSNFRNRMAAYGSLQFSPKSYHLAGAFIVPEYDILAIKKGGFKDERGTIFWNGHLYTSDKGKANFQFYTGDASKSYTMSIVGINAGGELITHTQKIPIQK